MQDRVRRVAGRHPLVGPAMPRWALEVLGKIIGRPLALRQVFSSKKLHDVGFEDVISLSDEVRSVVRMIS